MVQRYDFFHETKKMKTSFFETSFHFDNYFRFLEQKMSSLKRHYLIFTSTTCWAASALDPPTITWYLPGNTRRVLV